MKIRFLPMAAIIAVLPASAGESGLMRTFQPLDGRGAGGISIEQVTCYVSNFDSGQVSPIKYISTKNIPPTDAEKPSGDLNLASTCHISFEAKETEGKEPKLIMYADRFVVAQGYAREDILKACLECLRRMLPTTLLKTPLKFLSSAENREWMTRIVDEFNRHDRSKAFYTPPE